MWVDFALDPCFVVLGILSSLAIISLRKRELVALLCFTSRLFIAALWSAAGKGLTSCLFFVLFNCTLSFSYVVSWVRCGT